VAKCRPLPCFKERVLVLQARQQVVMSALVFNEEVGVANGVPKQTLNEHGDLILEMIEISKRFPGTQALDRVTFCLESGEVHAIVGENGAGKTTLMNVLNGVVLKDSGRIVLRGTEVDIRHPSKARQLGISFIHQELELVEALTVKENIALGQEPVVGFPKRISWKELHRQVTSFLKQWNLDLDPDAKVADLPLAKRQMTEIAKALFTKAQVIVMDEPTATLADQEVNYLFSTIRALKDRGCSIIYISHALEEITEIADRVTVLRNGQYVGTRPISEINRAGLIRMMVGESIKDRYVREKPEIGDVVLNVQGLSADPLLRDVSFKLRHGEVIGIAGLIGSGRTDLIEALYGNLRITHGEISICGKPIRSRSPREAIRAGLCYVPEDRRRKGLFLSLDVLKNVGASSFGQHTQYGLINGREEQRAVQSLVDKMQIRVASLSQQTTFLSGGNQQKVVVGKGLKSGFQVLMLNEPTRGIDVGAKLEIYRILNMVTEQGAGVLFISSELPEVIGMSDRILVMSGGRITGEFDRENANKADIMQAMFAEAEVQEAR